jgi:hypothetical protein
MYAKQLIYIASFVLVLALVGSTGADPVPPPWISADIGTPIPGSADWNPEDDSITITGNGHDIWDNADDFHYVYQEWTGDCDLICCVASFPLGPSGWQKAGVMVRQDTTPGSPFVNMVMTGVGGNGASFQWRDVTNGGCDSIHNVPPPVTEPYWIRLTRTGDTFAGYLSPDGIDWTQLGGNHNTFMTDPVYIGFCVTSSSTADLVTATFDNIDQPGIWPPCCIPYYSDPPNGAVDVPVDANLSWWRGQYTIQDEVYFGTDPCMANLPHLTTLFSFQEPLVDLPVDLVASTTYYWYVAESDGNVMHTPDEPWSFTTVRGECQPDYPPDGAIIPGSPIGDDIIFTPLDFFPGATTVKYTCYFHYDYDKVSNRAEDANLGDPPYGGYRYYVGLYAVPPWTESLVRGTLYYWTIDGEDALGNVFPGDIWEFSIQGFHAFAPNPPDEATFIPSDVLLSWKPGYGVVDHDIYFGTEYEAIRDARYDFNEPGGPAYVGPDEYLIARNEPNYMVTGLEFNTKYYWRVDQVNGRLPPPMGGGTYYFGPVWSFTTVQEGLGSIRMELWSGPHIGPIIHLPAIYPPYPDKPFETQFLTSFNSGTGLGDNYIGIIHGWLHPQKSGDYRFWICTDDNSELWLSSDESQSNMQLIAKESTWTDPFKWNNDESMSDLIPLVGGRKYYIKAIWHEGGGGDHCMVAWQGPDQPLEPVNGQDFSIIPGSRLSPYAQKWAHSPYPVNGQASVASPVTLRWGPGDHSDKHDVYISTDKALVDARDASAYKGRIDPNFYGPIALETGPLYYWAIDEVNDLEPIPIIWPGPTWMFRAEGAAGGLLGLYYHWDPATLPPAPAFPPYPGPPNPFQIFVMSRIDPEVNFNWGALPGIPEIPQSPDPNINVDYFAIKWIGHVECPVDADYTFYTTTDDGARLFIDGVQILPIEAWQQQEMTEWSGSVELTPGLHDIEMHMYESEGGAGAMLRWSAIPTNPADDPIPKQIIRPIYLWPPLCATVTRPLDESIIVDRTPALEWISGLYATTHELYFSDSFNDVNDRNPLVKETLTDPCRPYPALPPLQLGRTYYWCVDEVNSPSERWHAKTVWEFTISQCLSIDNMEDYNDRGELRLVWMDGYASVLWSGTYPYIYPIPITSGTSGANLNLSSAVGSPVGGATGPVRPTPLNYEAMVLRYDNDGLTYTGIPGQEKWIYTAPYFSEIQADTTGPYSLDTGLDWSGEGVKSLSLWFQGHPISDGDYDRTDWPAYTVSGRGRDIDGRHDEFYFLANYPLTTPGIIQVQVTSIDNTDPWAKAGVMIREKWTPYSKFAAVFMTPGQGVTFQWRVNEDATCTSITKAGVTLPQYVKLERTVSGNFIAKHSSTGTFWEDVNGPGASPQQPLIPMGLDDPNLYIGTAVTSHNALATCTADFDTIHVFATPYPSNWVFGDIGTNDPEQLYVALSDGTQTVVVDHPDPNAATLTDWQEWNIELTQFTGINLNSIEKVYIGLGDRDGPDPGGSGAIYIDDIRACPPRCVAEYGKPLADIATPYDCVVDEKDLRVLAADYLMRDELIVTVPPNPANLLASYQFEGNFLDTSGGSHHLTDPCSSSPGFDTGVAGSFALSLDGVDDYLVVNNVGVDGNVPRTITLWAKADHTNIPDWTLIFGFTGNADTSSGCGSHFNIGSLGGPGGVGAHVWCWEETIFTDQQSLDWHHYAMSYDGTTITYYGDGIEMDTDVAKSNVRNLTHADRIHVGKRATRDTYFPGDVDDARIYGVQLSKEEIAYIATGGAPSIHIPIPSDADLYKAEAPGNQWINLRDYSVLADQYLDEILWP